MPDCSDWGWWFDWTHEAFDWLDPSIGADIAVALFTGLLAFGTWLLARQTSPRRSACVIGPGCAATPPAGRDRRSSAVRAGAAARWRLRRPAGWFSTSTVHRQRRPTAGESEHACPWTSAVWRQSRRRITACEPDTRPDSRSTRVTERNHQESGSETHRPLWNASERESRTCVTECEHSSRSYPHVKRLAEPKNPRTTPRTHRLEVMRGQAQAHFRPTCHK
jgi:hypothetical protein